MASTHKKTIVITGATKGLGLALVEKFIELGHTVAGCGRSRAEIQDLQARFGPKNDFDHLDVSRNDDVAHWAKRIIANYGAPDLLLNNAALINKNAPLWEVPAAEFDKVIDVNIKGVANVIRHFVPAMISRNRGVIVNFSSGWGRSTSPEVAPYCATKWAMEGLSQSLAQELPSGMAAVALNPGIINTEMLQSCFGASARHYPGPSKWAQSAVPFLLQFGPKDNGQPLTVPGSMTE